MPLALVPRAARLPPALAAALAYAAGSVPVANVAARACAGVDLREVGGGTVSGTALYQVGGFAPLAVAGCAELAKGAVGPVLARRAGVVPAAACASLAVCGHDWSPFLRGRGLSLLLGALIVLAPEGAALLALALGAGRIVRETGASSAAALAALPAVLARRYERGGLVAGALLIAPVFLKRLVGNENRLPPSARTALRRLVYDADLAGHGAGRTPAGPVHPGPAGGGASAGPQR